MGASVFVPVPDKRVKKAMSLSQMSMWDVSQFYRYFQSISCSATHMTLERFYQEIDEPRNKYGDAIFQVLDINIDKKKRKRKDDDGNNNDNNNDDDDDDTTMITFGEFFHAVTSFNLFEKQDIIKFCFHVFDKDKNGYVENAELDEMIAVLHDVHDKKTNRALKGNRERAKSIMTQEHVPSLHGGGKQIEYGELVRLTDQFPDLWYPAFRVQDKLMRRYMGVAWWERKKRFLNEERARRAWKEDVVAQTNLQLERMRSRRVRKAMGAVRYYCSPWLRRGYEGLFPRKEVRVAPRLTREEMRYLERQKEKHLRHLNAIREKNPETSEWKAYLEEKKKNDGKAPIRKSTTTERQSRHQGRRKRIAGSDF